MQEEGIIQMNKNMLRHSMKFLLVTVLILLNFTACAGNNSGESLESLLSLGQKYLLEEKYEEAVVAFEKAIKIDGKCVEAYIGLTDSYMGLGEEEKALEVLKTGYEKTKEKDLLTIKEEIEKGEYVIGSRWKDDSSGGKETSDQNKAEKEGTRSEKWLDYDASGVDKGYRVYEFASNGNFIKTSYYGKDAEALQYAIYTSDSNDNYIKTSYFDSNDILSGYCLYKYEQPNIIKIEYYEADGSKSGDYANIECDKSGNWLKCTGFSEDGTTQFTQVYENDNKGNMIKCTDYNSDGSIMGYGVYDSDL
jgi:tetratricopeptide (TPR) repeat protein